MNINKLLNKYNLIPDNSIVIGSGILQALGIRESKDIDVVVLQDYFNALKETGHFTKINNQDIEILKDEIFEIGTEWIELGKPYEELLKESEVIDGVRYISLDFLLRVKKSWIKNDKSPRAKDIKDIGLIEEYIRQK